MCKGGIAIRIGLMLDPSYEQFLLERILEKGGIAATWIRMGENSGMPDPAPDLIVCHEDNRPENPGVPLAVLCRAPSDRPDHISMFQPFSRVYQDLLRMLAFHIREAPDPVPPFSLGIFSPPGGYEKNFLALALAEQFASDGLQTLYLNFDHLDLNDTFLESGLDNGFSRLFMDRHLFGTPSVLATHFTYDPARRFYFLSSPENYREKSSFSAEVWQEALEALDRSGLFQVLVLELAPGFDALNRFLMDRCGCLLGTHGGTGYGRICRDVFFRQRKSLPGYEEFLRKTLWAEVVCGGTPAGSGSTGIRDEPVPEVTVRIDPGIRMYLSGEDACFDPGRKAAQAAASLKNIIMERMVWSEHPGRNQEDHPQHGGPEDSRVQSCGG